MLWLEWSTKQCSRRMRSYRFIQYILVTGVWQYIHIIYTYSVQYSIQSKMPHIDGRFFVCMRMMVNNILPFSTIAYLLLWDGENQPIACANNRESKRLCFVQPKQVLCEHRMVVIKVNNIFLYYVQLSVAACVHIARK